MKKYVLLCSTLLLVAGPLLNGGSKQIASTVPAFAQAAALTATNVQAAFDTVQSAVCDAQALNYEVNFKGKSEADPMNLCKAPWLKPEDLAARAQILQGLKQYASELSGVTASSVNNVDTASTALGKSLTSLTGTAPFKALSAGATANLKLSEDLFATAVDALGNWLIRRKTEKLLPGEIEKMDPTIQSISQLLVADIGVVGANPKEPFEGSGLRQVLVRRYNDQMTAWNSYISEKYFENGDVKKGVSPDAALAAVKQLVALANQRNAADKVLAQVAATVKQMAQAHTELVKATKEKLALIANLSDLLAEAQRLNTYYQSLATSK